MAKVAFELRADHSDFDGGTVALPGGESFDVGAALKDGGGKISLDPVPAQKKGEEAQAKETERAAEDERIVQTLDSYEALKRAAAESTGGGGSTTSKEGD